MRFVTTTVLSAVDTTVDQTSAAFDSSQLIAASAQGVITTAGTGTLKMQFSDEVVPTHWSDITNATVATTGAGTYGIQKVDLCYRWVRLVYTKTSGTGTLTANLQGIGF